MKKILLFMTLFFALQSFSVFTENVRSPINDIGLKFCNNNGEGTKNANITTSPGGSEELCLSFFNNSEKEMTFVYGFSEGRYGKYGELLCNGDDYDGKQNNFGVLIPKTSDRIVTVGPKSIKEVKEKIQIPIGLEGEKIGCIAYKGMEPEVMGAGGMFNIVFRKASGISILIAGEGEIKSSIKLKGIKSKLFSTNKNISAILDDKGNLNIGFLLENDGNMDQKISLSGRVYNALGFEKTFEVKDRLITAGREEKIDSNVGIIPSYKGFFNIELFLSSEVVSKFDLSQLKGDFSKSTQINETGKIFIFTRIRLIIAIVAILIIYMILRPIFKKTSNKNNSK